MVRKTSYDVSAAERYDTFKLKGYYNYDEDAMSFLDIARKELGRYPDRILEIGIGTANFATALVDKSKRRVSVVGVDNSPHMIKKYVDGKKRGYGQNVRIFAQRAETMDLSGMKYPICVSHGFMMLINNEDASDLDFTSYIFSVPENGKAFERVGAHLTPGGIFLINVFGFGGDYHEPQNLPLDDGEVYKCKGISENKSENEIRKIHTIEDASGEEIWRGIWPRSRYTRRTIERELESRGFDVIGLDDTRHFFIARKK